MGVQRAAGLSSPPGPAAAGAAPNFVLPLGQLFRLCRALPGPSADLWAPRGPSQGRRVRAGAETGAKGLGVTGGFKMDCGRGELGRGR